MKRKIIISVLVVFALIVALYNVFHKKEENVSNIEIISEKEAVVSKNTIISTLTAPAEVASSKVEKVSLNTSYYYLTMCVEKEELVKKGENLLKYTNGTYLKAPYDCVVMDYNVPTAKEICKESNYVYISSLEDLYININISEEQVKSINVGQEVSLIANYDTTKNYTGKITKINEIGTRSTGGTTFAAIASVVNDGSLKLGMSINSEVVISKNEDLLTLPVEVVIIENNERYVNKINEDGSIQKVIVETGISDALNVEIISGLNEGDKVKYESITYEVISSDTEEKTTSIMDLFGSNKSREKGGARP